MGKIYSIASAQAAGDPAVAGDEMPTRYFLRPQNALVNGNPVRERGCFDQQLVANEIPAGLDNPREAICGCTLERTLEPDLNLC